MKFHFQRLDITLEVNPLITCYLIRLHLILYMIYLIKNSFKYIFSFNISLKSIFKTRIKPIILDIKSLKD